MPYEKPCQPLIGGRHGCVSDIPQGRSIIPRTLILPMRFGHVRRRVFFPPCPVDTPEARPAPWTPPSHGPYLFGARPSLWKHLEARQPCEGVCPPEAPHPAPGPVERASRELSASFLRAVSEKKVSPGSRRHPPPCFFRGIGPAHLSPSAPSLYFESFRCGRQGSVGRVFVPARLSRLYRPVPARYRQSRPDSELEVAVVRAWPYFVVTPF